MIAVIALTGGMFVVATAAGRISGSLALQVDALDFLNVALTGSLCLGLAGASPTVRARAAMAKGLALTVLGLWLLALTACRVLALDIPDTEVMTSAAVLGLAVNLAGSRLLTRASEWRAMRLCLRNDMVGNGLVIAAGIGVWATGTDWPDLVVALNLVVLFLNAALHILREAWTDLHGGRAADPGADALASLGYVFPDDARPGWRAHVHSHDRKMRLTA
jgi:Co/Zn/Cd efflux system component